MVPQRLAQPIALGGLVFFAYALVFFAYRYVFVFGRDVTGGANTPATVVDVMLFTVFALHHSVFARDIIRNRITRMVGVLERSTYVWIASALFIAVCAWWRPVGGVAWRTGQPAIVWALYAAELLGVWLTLRSAFMIDIRELAGIRQASRIERATADPAPQFTTSGPYGWVRHPIYSGWFLMVFAVPVMTMTRLVFAVTSSAYLLMAIPFEERSLRAASSGAYDRYMRDVRWKLLPRVF